MDATAGIAMASRRGLGRVKHVDTVLLSVQQVGKHLDNICPAISHDKHVERNAFLEFVSCSHRQSWT